MSRLHNIHYAIFVISFLIMTPLLSGLPLPTAEGEIIPFIPEKWELTNAKVVDHLERKALIGSALLKDVEFESGIIECDIFMKAGIRSYPGILFRVQSPDDYERIYLRPHRSPLYDDAVQYLAAFHGVDSWQLYNGPGMTSRAVIPTDRWVHVKLEILGTQARIFLDNSPQPVLVIGDLKHGKTKGKLGLTTMADGNSLFSNFSFREESSLSFPPPPLIHQPPGCILDWEVSKPIKKRLLDFNNYPDIKDLGLLEWTKVSAQTNGVLDISRICGRLGIEPDGIIARTTIQADKDGLKKYWFGYSDEVSFFINGQLIFYGNSAYRYRDTSFLGIMGLYDAVNLPLTKGDNELLAVIGETSGGWGLIVEDATFVYMAPGVEALWSTKKDFLIPESAVYDPETDAIFVSNYDGYNPSRGAGLQSISKLNPDGIIVAFQWISGLNNPTGLAVRNNRLYAVERSSLVEIDIPSAKIVNRTALKGVGMPNDVAVADNGEIYISDSSGNAIFKIINNQVEPWLKGSVIAAPNGIHVFQDKLIVGTNGDGCLKAVDLKTKDVSILTNLGQGTIDGISSDREGNLLVSHNEGRLFIVSPNGQANKIIDTTAQRMNMADFAYDSGRNIVIFPTFLDSRVKAFRLGN